MFERLRQLVLFRFARELPSDPVRAKTETFNEPQISDPVVEWRMPAEQVDSRQGQLFGVEQERGRHHFYLVDDKWIIEHVHPYDPQSRRSQNALSSHNLVR